MSLVQGVSGARAPWTIEQIHDTVTKIAAQARYGSGAKQSLLSRLLRYLVDRIIALLRLIDGTGSGSKLLLLAVILVAAVILARIVISQRLGDARRRLPGIRARAGERVDFWAAARDEAAAGHFDQACHAVYAAVIDTFARQGILRFHTSKTSGDYARDLRRAGAPGLADFRMFARQFDRAMFGETAVRAADYARLRELAERVVGMRSAA